MIINTHNDVIALIKSFANYEGFSGHSCVDCGSKFNALIGDDVFTCLKCENRNILKYVKKNKPHENPSFGITSKQIKMAEDSLDDLNIFVIGDDKYESK
jgi:DNA-directed RNA polymerase subunit RPC12/RpoP